MTDIVEKIIGEITFCELKIFAMEKILLTAKIDVLRVYTKNKNLIKCLKIWCFSKRITLKVQSIATYKQINLKKLLYRKVPKILKAVTWLIYYIILNRKLIGNSQKNWKDSDAELTFVLSFNTEPNYSKALRLF